MKYPIHPRDNLLATIPGAIPRKPGKDRKPHWRSKVMGSMVEGEDGTWRPAPVKEKDIRAQVREYLEVTHRHYLTLDDAAMFWLFSSASPIPIWVKSKLAEDLSHWSDFILFRRVPEEGFVRTRFLELKTKAGVLSKGQRLADQALGYHVPRSFEEAKGMIDEFYK